MRTASKVGLTEAQRQHLQWVKSSMVSVRLARRAQIVLLAAKAKGMDNEKIALELEIGRIQVGRWRKRFVEGGLAVID
jgi:hypothetical protein